MTTQDLIFQYSIAQNQLEYFLKDVSAEMAVTSPGNGLNPIRWILGHILTERVEAVEMAGISIPENVPDLSMYITGSDPQDPRTLPYEDLLAMIPVTFDLMKQAAEAQDDDQLSRLEEGTVVGLPHTFGQDLATYALHEMYHIGQISAVRKVV